ncbi:mesenchyme-specific cell surface glycoprotein-like [Diadema setosum]|uniref:mesenchyme-specific cell surface glycoprotein-like n=1 Tax=Diadema setosum TaxID=31175 RepID=UPI003B3AAB40
MSVLVAAILGAALAMAAVSEAYLYLEQVSSIYVPYSYLNEAKIKIDSDSMEQFAYDADDALAYVVGDDYLHIIDFTEETQPEIIYKHLLPHSANDIAHCGQLVAYVLRGSDSQDPGSLYVYRKYDRMNGKFERLFETTVNSHPEMVTFTPDCSRILTADEGTAGDDATEKFFLNREGRVSIITVSYESDPPAFGVKSVNFTDYNRKRQKYADLGVRFPYNGHYNNMTTQTLAESVEPEYIAINPTANVAYVNLQENNAIAILDLAEGREFFTEIVPLGVKEWINLELDPSDRDDAIAFQTGYDIKSFYMPDAIKYFEINGVGYLATADEGSDLDYRFDNSYWGDADRGRYIYRDGKLASTVPESLRRSLATDSELGRLEFSVTDGLSETEPGKIEELFFFGGRGFSIIRTSDFMRVYDSGDDIEHKVMKYFPKVFNSETYPDEEDRELPSDLVDKRSDNRGPECETIEVGTIDGETVLFVGVDRASVIAIYKVNENGQASFESLNKHGWTNRTFEKLFRERRLGDLDPKDIEFIPAANGKPAKLMVGGAASGTISLYNVKSSTDEDANSAQHGDGRGRGVQTAPSSFIVFTFLAMMAVLLR